MGGRERVAAGEAGGRGDGEGQGRRRRGRWRREAAGARREEGATAGGGGSVLELGRGGARARGGGGKIRSIQRARKFLGFGQALPCARKKRTVKTIFAVRGHTAKLPLPSAFARHRFFFAVSINLCRVVTHGKATFAVRFCTGKMLTLGSDSLN